jgi:hypoxanthine-DNA glycosylase
LSGQPFAVGFAPVANPDARILILGSLPSEQSLAAGEYYAHPQNAFWGIMRELTGAKGDYGQRCAAVTEAGIAIWDVLRQSVRPGSMDADIRLDTAQANDFQAFFHEHADLERVLFNGKKAEQMFARFVKTSELGKKVSFSSLPSTSPAYAAMSFGDKLARWRDALQGQLGGTA